MAPKSSVDFKDSDQLDEIYCWTPQPVLKIVSKKVLEVSDNRINYLSNYIEFVPIIDAHYVSKYVNKS